MTKKPEILVESQEENFIWNYLNCWQPEIPVFISILEYI